MDISFITWFDATYGLGFLKNTLAAFHRGDIKTRRGPKIKCDRVDQAGLEKVFDPTPDKASKSFPFRQVYVLHVEQEVLDRITSRKQKTETLHYPSEIQAGFTNKKLEEQWEELYRQDLSLEKELEFIKVNYPEDAETMRNQLWRRIHKYPLEDQWYWLKEVSNLRHWSGKFELKRVDLTHRGDKPIRYLSNLNETAQAMAKWISSVRQEHPSHRYFINVSQGNKELHTAWYLLNERGYLPQDTIFLQTRLQKEGVNPQKRFRPINFREVDKDIFQTLKSPRIYESANSPKRQALKMMLASYLELGFAVLVLGPRGTGKTRLLEDYSQQEVTALSCERLNDETFFNQEFLGKERSPGLLARADRGILFMDDLHLLSRQRQLELLPLLATDSKNQLKNYRDGRIKITLVGASNVSLDKLREEFLHPDFYDRVAQLMLDVPSLSEAPEDREADWEAIWELLKFPDACPKSPELLRWLRELSLPGNFRDLQRIAMSYQAWNTFPDELKKLHGDISSPLAFAKQEYEKQQAQEAPPSGYAFNKQTTLRQMEKDFYQALATRAHQTFGSDQKAADHFKKLDPGNTVTRNSLNKWRNGKYGD